MPRFHFNVYDGITARDHDGTELSDHEAARAMALTVAGELMKDEGRRTSLGNEWRLGVTDATSLVLYRIDFSIAESSAVPRSPFEA